MWKKFSKNSYFRSDQCYAGTDHTKNNRTFIALAPYIDDVVIELKGFKTIAAARKAADKTWPLNDDS
jgi:hypothetical protein